MSLPKQLPLISIITLTLNPDLNVWKQTLDSLKSQLYPVDKIEHLVMDGGSDNTAVDLAKSYACRVSVLPKLRDKSEARKGLGIKLAKGEVIAFIEADNPLPKTAWLKEMIQPFIDNPQIVGAFSIYNTYSSGMPALTKYCALFGVNDPLLYYLRKSEKLTHFQKRYTKGEILAEMPGYYVVRFNQQNLPTLGDNGHFVRRSMIHKAAQDAEKFIHVDAFAELLALKHDTYAAVKNSIVHYTGSNIFELFRRRTMFKEQFYNRRNAERTYYVFNPRNLRDDWKLLQFIIFSLTFIEPLFQSLRGYLVLREPAWFLHPIVCFIAVLSYTQSELKIRLSQFISKFKL